MTTDEEKRLSNRVVESRLTVRYAETDSMGIVYHANYLVWMEVGRTDYFKALGFTYRDLENQYKLFTPVVEATCRYHASAHYDDDIVVKTTIKKFNKRLIHFSYRIEREKESKLLAEGETIHLVVGIDRRRALFPEAFVDAVNIRSQVTCS